MISNIGLLKVLELFFSLKRQYKKKLNCMCFLFCNKKRISVFYNKIYLASFITKTIYCFVYIDELCLKKQNKERKKREFKYSSFVYM